MTMAGEGILNGCRYLLHDRDAKFSVGFDDILRSAGIEPLVLPRESQNLNAHLERWNRSVKEECLVEADLVRGGLPPHCFPITLSIFTMKETIKGRQM